jgi:chromosome segregation ATPase
LTPEKVLSRLGIKSISKQDFSKVVNESQALEAELEESEKEKNRWKTEAETCDVELEDFNERVEDMIVSIDEAMKESTIWDENDDPIQILEDRINHLINEYEALEAETESNEEDT